MKGNPWRQAMRKVYFGGDVSGPLFALAILAAAFVGIPSMWKFFVPAIGGGLVVATVLRRLHGGGG